MKVVFDTNVILDVLMAREPWVGDAARLMTMVDNGRLQGLVCDTSITTIHYLVGRATDSRTAGRQIETLLDIFDIAPVDRPVLVRATNDDFADYEDAVIHQAALAADATCIVSRDARGFKNSVLPVYTPGEMLKLLSATAGVV